MKYFNLSTENLWVQWHLEQPITPKAKHGLSAGTLITMWSNVRPPNLGREHRELKQKLQHTYFCLCFHTNHLKFVFQYVSILKMYGKNSFKNNEFQNNFKASINWKLTLFTFLSRKLVQPFLWKQSTSSVHNAWGQPEPGHSTQAHEAHAVTAVTRASCPALAAAAAARNSHPEPGCHVCGHCLSSTWVFLNSFSSIFFSFLSCLKSWVCLTAASAFQSAIKQERNDLLTLPRWLMSYPKCNLL